MARSWLTLFVAFGGMVISTPPMLLPTVCPTFPIVPKLVGIVIITSLIGKFTFCASSDGLELNLSNTIHWSKVEITSSFWPNIELLFVDKCVWIINI